MGDGTWHRGKRCCGDASQGTRGGRKDRAPAQVGRGNQSTWSDEPLANYVEPDHGKSEKCPELWDGHEGSAGVRVDSEVPGSMA